MNIDDSLQKLWGTEVEVIEMGEDVRALVIDATGQNFVDAVGKMYPLSFIAVVGKPLPVWPEYFWGGTLFAVSFDASGALELGEALQRCTAEPLAPWQDPPEACSEMPGLVCADLRNIAHAIRSFCERTGSLIPAFSSRDPLARTFLEYGNEYALSAIERPHRYFVTEDFRGMRLEDVDADVRWRVRPFVRASPWPFFTIDEWCAFIDGNVSSIRVRSDGRSY